MTPDWVLKMGLGGVWGPAHRRSTAWFECALMSCDNHEAGEGFCSLPPTQPPPPSNLLQPHLTITMQGSIYSTMSLCTHEPFPWHALERDTYTLTHMYTYVRAKRLEHTRAQCRKWKWRFLAFAAWLGCWGREGMGREKGDIWNGCGGG